MKDGSAYLHLFAQNHWHDDACVVGNTAALMALRSAIDKALSEQGHGSCSAFVNDGEGFFTTVVRVDDGEVMDRLAVPYTDEIASQCSVPEAIRPWELPGAKSALAHERAELEKKYPTSSQAPAEGGAA